MTHFKLKAVLIAFTCLVAACSFNTQSNPPSNGQGQQPSGQGQGQGQFPNRAQAAATPLPTRAIVANTSVAVDGALTLTVPAISVGFDQSSIVTAVSVTLGQTVKKGDVLAEVDATSLQDAVTDAQLALDLLQANLTVQNAPATEADLAAAQAALSAAYASYNTTKAGATQSEVDSARSGVESAWLGYLSAQISRDKACGRGTNTPGCQSASASFGNAYESWLAARDNYQKLLDPVSQNSLTQAYSSVASAQAKLDALKAGETTEQVKVDQAQLDQAKANLERAKSDLSKATLVSPCDCVVQEVNTVAGAMSSSNAFKLVDLSSLQFRTTNLVESNVTQVKIGAPVSIRLKPYTDTFSGTVSAVLAQSSGTQSDQALYTVLISLSKTNQTYTLLPGMTGQAEITTQ